MARGSKERRSTRNVEDGVHLSLDRALADGSEQTTRKGRKGSSRRGGSRARGKKGRKSKASGGYDDEDESYDGEYDEEYDESEYDTEGEGIDEKVKKLAKSPKDSPVKRNRKSKQRRSKNSYEYGDDQDGSILDRESGEDDSYDDEDSYN